jgi:hypothetical protein
MVKQIAIHLILLHGLHGHVLYINPDEVVAIRSPTQQSLIKEGFNCAIFTTDGKFVSVIETCDKVNGLLGQVPR